MIPVTYKGQNVFTLRKIRIVTHKIRGLKKDNRLDQFNFKIRGDEYFSNKSHTEAGVNFQINLNL